MFRNVLFKTLYEKRWMLIGWTVGMILITLFTLLFYPTFRETGMFEQAVENVPESMKAFIGDASSYNTISGYVNQQMFVQTAPIFLIILAVIFFTGTLAGEENQGTLETLLSQPISRSSVYLQKLAAGVLIVLSVSLGLAIGVLVSLPIINESLSVANLVQACLDAWAITMVFGVLGYALGAITGRRGFAGAITGAVAFVTYLIANLAPGVKSLRPVAEYLPFHFYNNPSTMQNGIDLSNIAVLLTISAVCAIAGLIVFQKRDIFQR